MMVVLLTSLQPFSMGLGSPRDATCLEASPQHIPEAFGIPEYASGGGSDNWDIHRCSWGWCR